ncbi:ABC transporter ATP-binding protein [Pseudoflavonifractor sp. MSJ-30]|uniref:ABC transporter ATP-binding protein n=1 Tax=Pseudoflavonifractor sp. MSJ-30 TaxID=2841525 RepID=UPI001C109DB3|nr:ABC transporter ATP-binding protein [Pseudoflavonifractor sp. MSJ-30]MBU5451817.1 ABC transporter ATP-binding protein [Pseudoflavonifractor sp. MSJ-30]
MENAVLKATGLTKSYGGTRALDGLELELPQGKIVGLLGPNGSGKTTFLKIAAGLLTPSAGELTICGREIGPETKAVVSYLPDKTYLNRQQRITEILEFFQDFYRDFDRERAENMLSALRIDTSARLKTLSKGNQEKVQLVLVMSRRAKLYLLDEPIGGVDPAARDYILNTIITNYDPSATVLISTHLIADVERVLDEFVFLSHGRIVRQGSTDETREETGKSLDELFREVFRCLEN